jgi:predicted transposase YbfD/YdcC
MIDGEEVTEIIIEIMKSRILKLGDILAVDGKAIRATAKKGKSNSALQILTAYFVESGVVLGQKYIHEKTNEIPVFQDMLCRLNIKGKTITADAMHCQKDTCRMIIAKEGNYVLGLKGNQALFYREVEAFIKNPENTVQIEIFEAQIEKHNGRTESRTCYKITDTEQFSAAENWLGLKTIFAVKRITTTKYGTSEETNYYITSLDVAPEKLLNIVRSHWKIESMHWLLDVVFNEDQCGILSENGQKTLNIFRKFALFLHRTYIQENNLKISMKKNMLNCLLNDDLLLQLCS